MGMKPRLEQPNTQIDPKLCTGPNKHPGEETYEHIDPKTVSCRRQTTNTKLDPNLVSGPKTHGG
jgi:hypothetical protein